MHKFVTFDLHTEQWLVEILYSSLWVSILTIEKNMHVLVLKFNVICDLGVVNPSIIDRQDGIK